jgi:hypothetical protein
VLIFKNKPRKLIVSISKKDQKINKKLINKKFNLSLKERIENTSLRKIIIFLNKINFFKIDYRNRIYFLILKKRIKYDSVF